MVRRRLRLLLACGIAPIVLAATPVMAVAATGGATPSHIPSRSHGSTLAASGEFTAALDPTTVRLQPVGSLCLLTINGTLAFTGTIQGTASGTTAALETAPCAEVAANPPGTFADVFRFAGTFTGTVGGQPAEAEISYAGHTAVGGSIDAVMVFSDGFRALLRVRATVAVGGTYRGVVQA
jgi:hypothetical protein